MREDLRKREQERTKKEIESIRIDEAKKYAQSLVDKGILKPNDVDKLESIDTEGLITIQVAQLEKEKKELSERLRIIAKRIDHTERAYRKEEQPLIAQDYERQQATDKETVEAIQRARLEAAGKAHQDDLATKARLSRMMGDYQSRRQEIIAKKGEEFARKKEAAKVKIEEEKKKRRNAVAKAREEERRRVEREEKEKAEKEAEERRIAEERRAEEERLREEEEAKAAAEEEAKRRAAEEVEQRRKQRELERQEAADKAKLQLQREEEAEAHRRQRAAEKAAPTRAPLAAPTALRATKDEPSVWRRGTPVSNNNSTPPTPTRVGAVATPPPRAESPSPAVAPARFGRGGAAAPAGGGWRAREAKNAGGAASAVPPQVNAPPARVGSPAPPVNGEQAKEGDDGFQTVRGGGVWRARRGGRT